jgi:nucleoside-diphosphate-sugar epimerase
MKYLILGSSGFIGGHLVQLLKSYHHEVIEYDILNGQSEDLRLSEYNNLKSKIEESDFIFFLAFDVGNAVYLQKNDLKFEFIHNNIKIIHNTFQVLSEIQKPFIFVSSQMADLPNITYGVLKKIGEKYTQSLNGVFVRLWNVYGDEMYSQKSHVVTDFIYNALNNKRIQIKTNGEEKRQFLFVDDCVKCLFILSEKYNEIDRDEIIDLTSFYYTSIIELAILIKEIVKDVQIEISDNISWNYSKKSPSKYVLKFWKPEIEMKEGINILLNNYR